MSDIFSKNLTELCNFSFDCDCGETHAVNGATVYGNYEKSLSEVVSKLPSDGRICLVSLSDTFTKFGKQIIGCIENNNKTGLNVIINRSFNGKLENLAGLLNLPNDIGAVILLDESLLNAVKYFSGLREIPVIFIPTSPNTVEFFNLEVALPVKGKEEKLIANNKKILILDKELLKRSIPLQVADTFCNIISRIVALIDYRIRGTMTKRWLCKNSYNFVRAVINDTFSVLKYKKEDIPFVLAESGAKISIASCYTQGQIFSSSAENSVAKLLRFVGEEHLPTAECRLVAMIKLLSVYKLFFEVKISSILEIPDYSKRAEILSQKTGISEREILLSIKENSFTSNEIDKKLFFITKEMLKEITGILDLKDKIINTYLMLGGNENLFKNFTADEVIDAIYSAPDIPSTLNTLTLIRDVGILEYLNV